MNKQNRLNIVDEARGFTLISMILYHFMWDLKYIAMFDIDWYAGPVGYVWQKSICISFIFISGFCFCFGKNRLKRSARIFICGIVITTVTLIVMPENRIVFGILTFIGTAGIFTILVDRLHTRLEKILNKKTLNLTMIIGMVLLFVVFFRVNDGFIYILKRTELPKYLYKGYIATFVGFPDPTFFSTDYFAILPWTFLYLAGYYTNRVVMNNNKIVTCLSENHIPIISNIGRKSLIIYMFHQPVLYAIMLLIQNIK
ncbi:MAG: heparan-alpha-glucosaminide N-acetyltransferase [Lachnospiraceae bacterium]|nr:heparan-alpha-glucosaminide N-acetyltransferase [Lachnospiraceae bacterium]